MTDHAETAKPLSARIGPWVFTALGAIYLIAAARGGEEVTYSTLKGIGFLLATPQACFELIAPGRLSGKATKLIHGIGYLGIAFVATGLMMDIFNL